MYYAHEDLADNVNTILNHNYNTGVTDSTDIYHRYEHHGTNVAGVIAARDNGIGVRGVAPRATIYGYNYLTPAAQQEMVQDINSADAMARNRVVTAVSNNSWGPRKPLNKSPARPFPLSDEAQFKDLFRVSLDLVPGLARPTSFGNQPSTPGLRKATTAKVSSMSSLGAMAARATVRIRMALW